MAALSHSLLVISSLQCWKVLLQIQIAMNPHENRIPNIVTDSYARHLFHFIIPPLALFQKAWHTPGTNP